MEKKLVQMRLSNPKTKSSLQRKMLKKQKILLKKHNNLRRMFLK